MSLIDEKPRTKAERQEAEPRLIEARRPDRRPSPDASAPAEARPRERRRWWPIALMAVLVIGAIVGGADWWLHARNWVSTDDAFIDTHAVQVSAQVAGRVEAVPVADNQEVRAGQPLVELDPADFQEALSQALANQESAQGQLAQAKAQLPVGQASSCSRSIRQAMAARSVRCTRRRRNSTRSCSSRPRSSPISTRSGWSAPCCSRWSRWCCC